jgi:hypothetical protein
VRARWASVTNEALREAHIAARIDHRSLEAQGIDREPQPHIPRAAFEMERHGYQSAVADRIRAEYQARVQARLERVAGREVPAASQPAAMGPAVARPPLIEPALVEPAVARPALIEPALVEPEVVRPAVIEPAVKASAAKRQSLEDIRREARENWLRLRQSQDQDRAESASFASRDRVPDDDLAR